jgi:limonene-1,2-epoxide hydrolase
MRLRNYLAIAGLFALLVVAAYFFSTWRSATAPAAVIDGYLAAWNAHDPAAAAMFLAPDVDYFDASVGVSVRGRDAVKAAVIENFLNAVADSSWVLTAPPFVQGTKVSFQWRYSGINTGAWADGTPPSNAPFSFEGRSVSDIVNGKIAYQADYYDASSLFRGGDEKKN